MKHKAAFFGATVAFVALGALGVYVSGCSNPVTSEEVQQAPRALKVSFNGSAVKLNWEPSVKGEESGYEIWRSEGGNKNFAKIGSVGKGVLNYSDTSFKFNKTYYYKIRTVYGTDPGEFSNEALINLNEGPRNLTGHYDGSAANLSWQASVTKGETRYEVWRSEWSNQSYTKVGAVGKNVHSFRDTGIQPNVTYFYKVKTIYGSDPGKFSNEISIDTYTIYIGNEKNIYRYTTDGRLLNEYGMLFGPITGLASDGQGYIWCIVDGKVFKLRCSDMYEVGYFPLTISAPTGLAFDGTYLYINENLNGTDKIHKYTTAGSYVYSFNAPSICIGGLAYNGQNLYGSEYYYDPEILEIGCYGGLLGSIPSPCEMGSGIGYNINCIWLYDSENKKVYRVSKSGGVLSTFPVGFTGESGLAVSGPYPN